MTAYEFVRRAFGTGNKMSLNLYLQLEMGNMFRVVNVKNLQLDLTNHGGSAAYLGKSAIIEVFKVSVQKRIVRRKTILHIRNMVST